MKVFLSYNHGDSQVMRDLGVHLTLVGADVWFDDWEIRAGDSIPGKLNEGLDAFEVFVLAWSERAARSDWVRAELEAAIQRKMGDALVRIIPVRLDATELPALIRPLRWLDYRCRRSIREITDQIMGFACERDKRRAMQRVLETGEIDIGFYHGYGPILGCPQCGAGLNAIEGWNQVDRTRGDQYAGARCRECGWNDGGEV